jgi:hypothetical protein
VDHYLPKIFAWCRSKGAAWRALLTADMEDGRWDSHQMASEALRRFSFQQQARL